MIPRRTFHDGFRVTALLAAASMLFGCSSYRMAKAPPEQAIAQAEKPPQVRITMLAGDKFEMEKAGVEGDSLIGVKWRRVSRPNSWQRPTVEGVVERGSRLAVALQDIQTLEILRPDAVKTVLLVTGVGALVALAAVAVVASSDFGLSDGGSGGGGGGGGYYYSCPWVESWDGTAWHLDSGTYGGAFLEPLARTDVSLLAHAATVSGTVRLRLSNPPGEQDFVDELKLVAVDHRPGTALVPDPAGEVHVVDGLSAPLAARDLRGADALARVAAEDGIRWESSIAGRDPAVAADLRDGLELEFARPPQGQRALLVVDGNNSGWTALLVGALIDAHGAGTDAWYREMNADPEKVKRLAAILDADGALAASLWDGTDWADAGHFASVGAEAPKRQGLLLDLSGVPGDRVRVRLECAPSFWLIDRVALAGEPEAPAAVCDLAPARAAGPLGADVRGPLAAADGAYLAMAAGDTVHLEFAVLPVPAGMTRTYLARTAGWYRIEPTPGAQPDSVSLRRLLTEPHAVARMSVERANRLMAN